MNMTSRFDEGAQREVAGSAQGLRPTEQEPDLAALGNELDRLGGELQVQIDRAERIGVRMYGSEPADECEGEDRVEPSGYMEHLRAQLEGLFHQQARLRRALDRIERAA